jgi:hypothetical protein
MSRHRHDGMTVHDTDFLGPPCFCTAVHILDAFYRKHRHRPSSLSLKIGKRGSRGGLRPSLFPPHARAMAVGQ